MREQAIPELEWKVRVSAARACNKRVLESLNGLFGSIAMVDIVRD